MANFLLLARLIGPSDYGLVAAAWALVLTLGPVATFGAGRLVVRDISGLGQDGAEALSAALLTVLAGTAMAAVVIAGLHPLLLPQVPFLLLASLAVADIGGIAIWACLSAVCLATGHARASGVLAVTVALGKIAAVVTFAVVDGKDPVVWALLYAGFSTSVLLLQLSWALHRFGRPVIKGYRFLPRVREGLTYSTNQAAAQVKNDSDKVVLVRAGYTEEAGLYSLAYRLATTASMPVLAVLGATFHRFFAVGAAGGITATAALGRRLAVPLAAYCVVVGFVLVLAAPLLPVLVGDQYAGSVSLLMVLSALPLLRVGQALMGDALTGSGRQEVRTRCAIGAAGVALALNLAFIPRYGVVAALVSTFVSEVTSLVLLGLAVRRHRRAAQVRGSGLTAGGPPEVADRAQ